MAPDHDPTDAHVDAALEALARPAPPADQVARVLANTGPDVAVRAGSPRSGRDGSPSRPSASPFRWALPIAATLLVGATTWMLSPGAPVDVVAPIPAPTAWSQPREVDRPVLPPQAYWGMDALDEFRSLRPEAGHPGIGHARAVRPHVDERRVTLDDELASTSLPTGLPEIELAPIVSAPIEIAPPASSDVIALAEIPLEPIVIAPLSGEENP